MTHQNKREMQNSFSSPTLLLLLIGGSTKRHSSRSDDVLYWWWRWQRRWHTRTMIGAFLRQTDKTIKVGLPLLITRYHHCLNVILLKNSSAHNNNNEIIIMTYCDLLSLPPHNYNPLPSSLLLLLCLLAVCFLSFWCFSVVHLIHSVSTLYRSICIM